jgi:uncharacterized repeat protein (TIGR01451 family)
MGSVDGFTSLKTADWFRFNDNESLVNFSGFDSLELITGIYSIKDNALLENIPNFNSLKKVVGQFEINGNPLIQDFAFENLDSILGFFQISDLISIEDLSGFDKLKSVNEQFVLSRNSFSTINAFQSLNNVGIVFFQDNNQAINLHCFDPIQQINYGAIIRNNISLESLFSENGALNLIKGELEISNCPSLYSLSGLHNVDPEQLSNIEIKECPELNMCNVDLVCTAIELGKPVLFQDNGLLCNNEFEVRLACDIVASHIYAEIFFDTDQNGIKTENEPYFPDAALVIEGAETSIINTSGPINHFMDYGTYNVSAKASEGVSWMLTSSPENYQFDLSESNLSDSLYFGYYPTTSESGVESFIHSRSNRCNADVVFTITAKNQGTTLSSGTLWFKTDPNIIGQIYYDMPDHSIGDSIFGWDFGNLFPAHSIAKTIKLSMPGVEDFNVGDSFNHSSYVEYNDVNGDHSSQEYLYQPIFTCAFDPNDKLVHPDRENHETLFDEQLHYTIRFQNTGNDVAYDIRIIDTLDSDLDPSSFRMIGSSHLNILKTTIRQNIIDFQFSNIFLPDSTTDLEGSQGYVSFIIAPKQPVVENTIVTNSGSIYFDFNPPIHTNETVNVFVSMLTATNDINLNQDWKLELYPNPTSDILTIDHNFLPRDYQIEIFDYSGKKVFSGTNTKNAIDVSSLNDGVYFTMIKFNGRKLIKKFVVQN